MRNSSAIGIQKTCIVLCLCKSLFSCFQKPLSPFFFVPGNSFAFVIGIAEVELCPSLSPLCRISGGGWDAFTRSSCRDQETGNQWEKAFDECVYSHFWFTDHSKQINASLAKRKVSMGETNTAPLFPLFGALCQKPQGSPAKGDHQRLGRLALSRAMCMR